MGAHAPIAAGTRSLPTFIHTQTSQTTQRKQQDVTAHRKASGSAGAFTIRMNVVWKKPLEGILKPAEGSKAPTACGRRGDSGTHTRTTRQRRGQHCKHIETERMRTRTHKGRLHGNRGMPKYAHKQQGNKHSGETTHHRTFSSSLPQHDVIASLTESMAPVGSSNRNTAVGGTRHSPQRMRAGMPHSL